MGGQLVGDVGGDRRGVCAGIVGGNGIRLNVRLPGKPTICQRCKA
jgi:hypothetical protein